MTEEVDMIKRIRSQSRAGADLQGLVDALISGIMSLAERVSNSNSDSNSLGGISSPLSLAPDAH